MKPLWSKEVLRLLLCTATMLRCNTVRGTRHIALRPSASRLSQGDRTRSSNTFSSRCYLKRTPYVCSSRSSTTYSSRCYILNCSSTPTVQDVMLFPVKRRPRSWTIVVCRKFVKRRYIRNYRNDRYKLCSKWQNRRYIRNAGISVFGNDRSVEARMLRVVVKRRSSNW